MVGMLVLLTLAAPDSVASSSGEPEVVSPVRFHGEVSLLGAGAMSAVPSVAAGGGLHLEAGLVLGGDSVLSARASFATVAIYFVMQFGVSYAHRIGDHMTLGVGATWGGGFGVVDLPGATSVQVPVRFTYLLGEHARRGFVLGVEVAPGVAYSGGGFGVRPTLPTASVIGQLTFGYAVW